MTITKTASPCWKDGCDLDATHDYWCEDHYAQRRAHIQNEMAKLAEAEFEVKTLEPTDTTRHDVDLIMTRQRWQWKCSCGLVGKTMARTEGIAKSAGDRHRRAMGVVEYL